MKTSSAKAKGRSLQNLLLNKLKASFPNVQNDIRCAIMGESGTDIKMGQLAHQEIPYSFECKNQEHLNIWDSLKQCEANKQGEDVPILVFKRNRSEVYACLPLDDLMKLLK